MTIPENLTMVQRCEEIRALLAFERPENPETNEIEWQSFLRKRHDLYTKFPYDSDDEDEDAKTQKRQSYSSSDAKPESNSFLRLTEALPAPSPQTQIKTAKKAHSFSEDTETETINTRLHTTLMQSSHSIHTLQSCFNSELALLTSRYSGFSSLNSLRGKNGEKLPLHVDTYEIIGDTLSLCAFFLSFPKLESQGMEFAEVLKNGFWFVFLSPIPPSHLKTNPLPQALPHHRLLSPPSTLLSSSALPHSPSFSSDGVTWDTGNASAR
ncbi:hypothetical protein BPAE_0216g00200 [Botrytis paeoniae]|uniref:Uncharacterized protein n=1 Tax=Botrytis paeoniae TaxID=278948 RepID=A0A4Z1FDV4_9HELO|nr:hypothetical protein BPAE_0216g00200 [Botrytis paeoniae]